MNFEDELRSAMRRKEPSPDFTAQVLARAWAAPGRRAPQPWVRWVAGLAAALVLAVLLGAGGLEYRRHEGQRAKAQVLLAVRIAGGKLNKAQKKVQMLTHRSNS